MSAVLEPVAFDHALFEAELAKLDDLLRSKADLSERDDIQPLFKASRHLTAFLGTYDSDIGPATEIAFEFPFFGDCKADVVVGSRSASHFCVVEFEDGRPDSIFKVQPRRANPEWGGRFEHGFSQLADWFFNLDDYKKTHGFARNFGHGHVSFSGLLVIGRSMTLDGMRRTRLRWRTDKVRIDSNVINCVTFDDLCETFRTRYNYYKAAASLERALAGQPGEVPEGGTAPIEPE